MKVFVIIVTFNCSKWIDKCFESLASCTVPVEIIAVDNGSTDNSLQMIRTDYPFVEVVEVGQNIGFGKANNIGIKKAYDAGADYIFLLNQDAWVERDTIEKLIDVAERNPQYGIISPVHLNGEGNALDYGFLNCLCRRPNRAFFSDLYLKSNDDLAEIYPLDFVNAAFWLLPRKTIELVGGFNPFFFQYGEDRDYVNRCRYFNLAVGFVPTTRAYHDRIQHDSDTKRANLPRLLLLIRLFDPQEPVTVESHIKELTKAVFKNLLRFQIQQARSNYFELAYYQAHRVDISKIANKLKAAGLTFLD